MLVGLWLASLVGFWFGCFLVGLRYASGMPPGWVLAGFWLASGRHLVGLWLVSGLASGLASGLVLFGRWFCCVWPLVCYCLASGLVVFGLWLASGLCLVGLLFGLSLGSGWPLV